MQGSQNFAADARNAAVLIHLNGALVPREAARVSIFDSGFVLGDGVWEGLRLHKGGGCCSSTPISTGSTKARGPSTSISA
jgi:hypothetical protein